MFRYGTTKASKRKYWSNQSLPQAYHKCAIPLQKLTYLVLEATGHKSTKDMLSLLWTTNGKPTFTNFPQAMPDQYKRTTSSPHGSIISYRHYYISEKQHFAKWDGRTVPSWWSST
jgi:hypothetical protein